METNQPLVSCIMPTFNRRAFAGKAIEYFLRQDYPNRELIILDDGSDAIGDLVPTDPRIRYMRLDKKYTIGSKRNFACQEAAGEIIVHWDDDDWMAPNRIRYQVENLSKEQADICGLDNLYFFDPSAEKAWQYVYPKTARQWLAGGTLCYQKSSWKTNPFPEIKVGEDTRFVWNFRSKRILALDDNRFYAALVHAGNTSPKRTGDNRWHGCSIESIQVLLGPDYSFYHSLLNNNANAAAVRSDFSSGAANPLKRHIAPGEEVKYSIIMVVHNALDMVKLSTLRTLKHIDHQDARLIVVDNASADGTESWLDILARRGDIRLIRSKTNIGHGPGLELARREIRSPFIVTLDSDAFPLTDDWLEQLGSQLNDQVKVAGIRHHRDYIHPSCLMISRLTLEEFNLTFLNEKDRPSQLDVAERISCEIKRRGFIISGLEKTAARRRGSISEPVYLGSAYQGIVYHQWYTTRAAISAGRQVDDVPSEAISRSLREVIEENQAESREIIVVLGVRAAPEQTERLRNARAALWALNLQTLPRWRYRIVVVEQDSTPRLKHSLAPLCDNYLLAYNPGPYNRSWAFNIGAKQYRQESRALCFLDADILVPADFLSKGLEQIQAGYLAVCPYSEVMYLDPPSTAQAIKNSLESSNPVCEVNQYKGTVYTTSQGGAIWVEPALYFEIGGHNEEFRGWGCEDREFWDRLARKTQIRRLPGILFHLHHPPPAMQDPSALANQKLYRVLLSQPHQKPAFPVGELHRYTPDTPPQNGEIENSIQEIRDWENWHGWTIQRIENILYSEKKLTPEDSARSHLASMLPHLGERILDVGCGPGALWPYLEPYRPRVSWQGTDITYNMVKTARRFFPQVPVCNADAGNLPFGERSFEVVVLRHVLEHLPPWLMARAALEAMRVAAKSIVLVFHVPPLSSDDRSVKRDGENFLEIQWSIKELENILLKDNWRRCFSCQIRSDAKDKDTIWILNREVEKDTNTGITCVSTSTEKLKISIIMPTYTRSHCIFRTVETIQRQVYSNWELIIIDNEGGNNYDFHDPRIRVYCDNARTGASYARNQGIRYAAGDLVCFFDDDDDMFPAYLERFARVFQDYPHVKMVRCGMIVSNGQVNFSYATPECCLRKQFASPTWLNNGPGHDQYYFRQIISRYRWSEEKGDIIVIPVALCRANTNPSGGLRSGKY